MKTLILEANNQDKLDFLGERKAAYVKETSTICRRENSSWKYAFA